MALVVAYLPISGSVAGPVLAAEPARSAEPAEPVEPAGEAAMLELNARGFEFFEAGRYVEAAESFRKAYQVSPDPNLQKNEAIAWFKAGRCGAAVPAANGFLLAEEQTREHDRVEARAVLANCKVDMARQSLDHGDASLARDLLDEAASLQPDEYTRERIEALRAELPGASAPLDESLVRDAAAARDLTDLAAWSLVGAGAAILVSAVVYHVMTLDAEEEFLGMAGEGGDRQRFDALAGQLDTARWLLPTLYVAGAASSAAGVYLLVSADEPSRPGMPGQAEAATTALFGIRFALP